MSRMSSATTRPPCADAARGDFAPAARRRAEIDDARALFQQMKFVVDLGELVSGARAKTFALGARHIGIVDLAFEPGARGGRAAFVALEPRHDASGFAPHAVGAHHLDQHALAQTAIGDAQSLARKKSANGVEDGAAGEHEIGALGADAGIGRALVETHRHELADDARYLIVGQPAAVDAPAIVAPQAQELRRRSS